MSRWGLHRLKALPLCSPLVALVALMASCASRYELLDESPTSVLLGQPTDAAFITGDASVSDASAFAVYAQDAYVAPLVGGGAADGGTNNGGLDCNSCAVFCPNVSAFSCDGGCLDGGFCTDLCRSCLGDASQSDATLYNDASDYDAQPLGP